MERHRLYPKPTQAPVEESDQRAFERAFKPADKIEQMFCDDTAHADARAKRLRDWQDALIATKLREGLFNILRDIPLGLSEAEYLVENWSRGVPEAKAKVCAILAGVGLNEISIEAEAFQLCAASFVTFDRLQGS